MVMSLGKGHDFACVLMLQFPATFSLSEALRNNVP